jgi:hypothetical protein
VNEKNMLWRQYGVQIDPRNAAYQIYEQDTVKICEISVVI